jgi:hypothetical protein
MLGYSVGDSLQGVGGSGYTIVSLAENDRPAGTFRGNRELTKALRLGPGGCSSHTQDCMMQYELDTAQTQGHHGSLCPGTYRLRAWARRTDEYNGFRTLAYASPPRRPTTLNCWSLPPT